MATSKTLELSIKIAGRMDKSLTAAINGTQSKIGSLTKSIGAAAKLLLQAIAMLPDAALTGDGIDATYGGDYFYANNAEAERCLIRGGNWAYGGSAGVFSSRLSSPRSNAHGALGGRSAFYE